jgi:hypothetical protein
MATSRLDDFTSPSYDFYSVLAPADSRLPGGRGDNGYIASCQAFAPCQTRVNGTAASFPGVSRSATLTYR